MSDIDPRGSRESLPEPESAPRRGLVARLVQRLVMDAVRPLYERLTGQVRSVAREITPLRRSVEENERRLEDLRAGFLATRAEFEEQRDTRVPELSRQLDALASGTVAAIQNEVEAMRDRRLPQVEEAVAGLHAAVQAVQADVANARDERLMRVEADLSHMQDAIEQLQVGLADVRDTRVKRLETSSAEAHTALEAVQEWMTTMERDRVERVERQADGLHAALETVQRLAEEVRDQRLPALADRTDALVGRLHEETSEVAGLVERLIMGEPLHITASPEIDAAIPAGVREASLAFLEAFRGSEREIITRSRETVSLLRGQEPILDLGCGRGELLLALREEGVTASGVDDDPAMVAACRRRGLDVEQADLLDALKSRPPESLGAVTAVHVLEHLPAATWMTVIETASRALRSGGLLIAECPNPDSLRVGAGLFWMDPTHWAPIHPEALGFVAGAVGLEVVDTLYRRPFPPEQRLRQAGQSEDVAELAERLDAWLSAPRDYVMVARKP